MAFGAVVRRMAERGEVTLCAVARIVIEMRARQHHAGDRRHYLPLQCHPAILPGAVIGKRPPAIVMPTAVILTVPAVIDRMRNEAAVRAAVTSPLAPGT